MFRIFTVVLTLLLATASAQAQLMEVRQGVSLNMRKGPGTNHPVTGRLEPGEIVMQVGATVNSEEWIRVKEDAGNGNFRYGWVHTDFVDWVNPLEWSREQPGVSILSSAKASGFEVVAVNESKSLAASYARNENLIQIWRLSSGELVRSFTPSFQVDGLVGSFFFIKDEILKVSPDSGDSNPVMIDGEPIARNAAKTILIDVSNGRVVGHTDQSIDGPLERINVDGTEIRYSFSSFGIDYYRFDDYSTFTRFSAPSARKNIGEKTVQEEPDDMSILDVYPAGNGRPSAIALAFKLKDGSAQAGLISHKGDVLGKSAKLPPGYEILGLNRHDQIIYARGENPDSVFGPILEFKWSTGEKKSEFENYYPCIISHNGSLACVANEWFFVRIFDSVEQKSFRSNFSDIDDIHYFDGTTLIFSGQKSFDCPHAMIASLDIATGEVTDFGACNSLDLTVSAQSSNIFAVELGARKKLHVDIGQMTVVPDPDEEKPGLGHHTDFVSALGHRFKMDFDWKSDVLPFAHGILFDGAPLQAPSGPLYRSYDERWVVDRARRRFVAATEAKELVIAGPEPEDIVTLDIAKVHEIIQTHFELEPQKNDADIPRQLLELTTYERAGFNTIFTPNGAELIIVGNNNSSVSRMATFNDINMMLNKEFEAQGKPGILPVKDLANARGLELSFYRFDAETGAYLGKSVASEHDSCNQPTFVEKRLLACVAHNEFFLYDLEKGISVYTRSGIGNLYVADMVAIPGGEFLAIEAEGGHIDFFNVSRRAFVASLHPFDDGGWLIRTEEGFYAAGGEGDHHLRAAYGVERSYSIDKFRDTLYRPDLVAEALKGDPEGLVREAVAKVSLETILQSGAAPEVIIKGDLQGESVKVEAAISDAGGGIGRLEWRVNGVVQQTRQGKASDTAELYLAEGENRIELVAYNRENTIQGRSEPLTFAIGEEDLSPPRLFILAVGVNDYSIDELDLKYAVNDAETVASGFAQAGAGLYGEIFTEVLTDEDVTRSELEKKFREIAKSIRPNDVFVFFAAGHGKTLDGRFFFIPQDFSGTTLASIRQEGIGHAAWQEWFSMIPAQKSLLMFDSCESGAVTEGTVGRELRFRAANDLLGNATGRALISASSSQEYSWEGYEDHGVFAWSILEALSTADRNENGTIDIDELADSIEETVPRIAKEAFGEKQTPQFKAPMRGFDIVRPLEEAAAQ